MTKKQHISNVRTAPLGPEGIEALRRIVRERQATKVNEVLIDIFTASTIVQVFDAVNDRNRQKLLSLPVARVAGVCFAVTSGR
jgi:hypothetical protein